MRDAIAGECAALAPRLIETRRRLHRHPELAFEEHETAALVVERLLELGYAPRTGVGGTGVVADLEGAGDGPTLLIRADMDALALDEVAGRPYGSQIVGRMHACGHDAHTSALLGVAALLRSRREQLAGRVRLLFQPAEEIGAGALAVITDAALDGVDEAIMAHVFSALPVGVVALREGAAMAGADFFALTVEGGGGHAGMAHETRDAVLAAAQLVSALQAIVARETAPTDFLVLGVASIAGGTTANVVADEVTLRGTMRWLDRGVRERALARMAEISTGVCSALRVTHRLDLTATVPVMRCAPAPITLLAAAARDAGVNAIDPGLLPVSEDFANVAERVPAAFIGIGAGGDGYGSHHSPHFDIDERAIALTAEVLARAALARLTQA